MPIDLGLGNRFRIAHFLDGFPGFLGPFQFGDFGLMQKVKFFPFHGTRSIDQTLQFRSGNIKF
jgi:hypothetical protein